MSPVLTGRSEARIVDAERAPELEVAGSDQGAEEPTLVPFEPDGWASRRCPVSAPHMLLLKMSR